MPVPGRLIATILFRWGGPMDFPREDPLRGDPAEGGGIALDGKTVRKSTPTIFEPATLAMA
jgi:hypothetical protein